METGTVKWFNESLGFGYVSPDDVADEIYVSIAVLRKYGVELLKEGQRIEYEMTNGVFGRQICFVRII